MTSDLSCFLLFFTFSLSFQSLALCHTFPLFELMCIHGHKWRSQLLLACALMDLVGSRGCDGWSDFVQHLPSVGSRLGGKKKKKKTDWKLCVRRREKTEEEGKYTMPPQVPVASVIGFIFIVVSGCPSLKSCQNYDGRPPWCHGNVDMCWCVLKYMRHVISVTQDLIF